MPKKQKYIWQPHPGPQTEALQRSEKEILFGGSRGGGKSLQQNTKILLPNGLYKQIKNVKVGEQVVSIDGKPTTVIGVYPQKAKQLYRITFDDGAWVDTDLEHRWLVWSAKHGWRDGWIIKTTGELLNEKGRYSIPLMDNGFDGQYIPKYDPYILGLILGDGCMTGSNPTIYTPDIQIRDYLVEAGWNVFLRKDKANLLYQCYNYKDTDGIYKELDIVSGKDKYVPERLFQMSAKNRLALLQGLLDSDGSCEKTGSVRFSTTSMHLAEAVQYLVRSLGGKSSIRVQKPRITGFGTLVEEITVSIGHICKFKPFRLEKKAVRVKTVTRENKRYIKSIEPSVIDKAVCIAVDNPSHLYVIQDFIVTHNTDAGIVWMVEPEYITNPAYRGLVLRLNATDLGDWLDRADRMYSHLGAKMTGNPAEFLFPSGAKIRTGHLADEEAYNKYKGHEYQKILIEELTQIPSETRYLKLLGSCRSTIPGLMAQIFCTTNPDGVGHMWVKKRFIEGKPRGKTYYAPDGSTRVFIESNIEDNPTLLKTPDYMQYLESMKDNDPELYKQWRYGDWTSFQLKGSIYGDLIDKAYEDNRVIRFPIEPSIPVNGLWDLGMDDSMAIWLFQYVGREVRFVGYYENMDEPFQHYYDALNQLAKDRNFVLGIQYIPHDGRVRELSTGVSRLSTLKDLFGYDNVMLNMSEKSPIPAVHDGIEGVKRILATAYFHADYCEKGLDTLKMYRRKWNEKMNVYLKDPIHDEFSHCADALRTGASVIIPGTLGEYGKKIITPAQLNTLSQMTYYQKNPKELRKLMSRSIRNNRR